MGESYSGIRALADFIRDFAKYQHWPASPRPAGLARAGVEATQLSPTPRDDQKRPGKGGGQMATFPGLPA